MHINHSFWGSKGSAESETRVHKSRGGTSRRHMKGSTSLLEVLLLLASINVIGWGVAGRSFDCRPTPVTKFRPHRVTITEFGAVGDGITLNTKAFENAMFYLNSFSDKGGAQLFIPPGRWLTGSFHLISHLTVVLDKEAVILGSEDSSDWPVIDPLPSYGRGRELPGGRHRSLIYGFNLTDVVITGDNGTINGQGSVWWSWFQNNTLDYTRPHLIELVHTDGVVISNLTLLNSPFWTIHPVYCSQVHIKHVTITAPHHSPNTDGIDPDSSRDVCIEDCYISTGDDLISIKSGWDEYGIAYARPSSNIVIRRISGESGRSSGISLGSEMSGGISEVYVEDAHIFNSVRGIRIKTSPGRGGFIENVYISKVVMSNVKTALSFTSHYGEHPDENYDPNALPTIKKITFNDISGNNIIYAGFMEGIEGSVFLDICLSNITLNVMSHSPWNCSYILGYSEFVSPELCQPLSQKIPTDSTCYVPKDLSPQVSHANRLISTIFGFVWVT
ncbi:probable polygalacturonase [Nymphaea colorata]|nr:probable polygalacturonase [Nymphaea colorata]